ncbi:MAG: response regulator [Eubacteriales bacterium]|nr:response regulator [Eubacteriales bacterium]
MKPWMYAAVLLVNVLVFICIGEVYSASGRSYSQKLLDENIRNVENLNAASANAAYTYTGSMGIKIDDAVNYIEARSLTYGETVKYLGESNTNPDRQFQLVKSGSYGEAGNLSFGDYTGVSIRKVKNADGGLVTRVRDIRYGSGYYDIFQSFTDVHDENSNGVCFAAEFTDPDTKLKCFAVYRHTVLTDAAGRRSLYTVLLAVNSQKALNAYNVQKKYDGQSTVLVNADGDYIIKNSDYRNVNFYDYIVNYNGLTLDWRDTLRREILETTADGAPINLFYKNHRGADCVFSVAAMENGWYSITCVPLADFNSVDNTVNYSLIILLLFLFLFLMDGVAIYFGGKAMSYNVSIAEQATREANEANLAKSRFLSTMSHELRTPLNAIIGFVTLSRDSIGNPTILRDFLKKIDVSSKLLLQLISDILDVSAIESNKMKLNISEFDMTKLLTSLSAIYYGQCAAKGIDFNVVLKNMHAETLIGDDVRVNQVLLNFLSNAVKFTPSGGNVTLRVEQVKREAGVVVIRFTVSDTGCGISDELRTRLFQPFERATGEAAHQYSGTGLGLSITKNLSELMGGSVGVESREGEGSSFWTELPFGIPEKTTRRGFSPIEDMRVLAVVRNADEREYIGQILTGFGVKRSLADSADAALRLLREACDAGEPFDLCILDWKLEDLNALDAAKKIRGAFSDKAPHIMILAYDLADANHQCAAAGAELVLGKPVFPSALYNALESIVTDQVRVVPEVKKSYALDGKRVLLVEDNLMNTEIAKLLLDKVGVEVETAADGQIGCEAFIASEPGRFDAILMDVQMPVMDGYQAAKTIRASAHPQAKTIPIIAMTADAFSEDVGKAHEAGMNEHLSKPVMPESLYEALKRYLC